MSTSWTKRPAFEPILRRLSKMHAEQLQGLRSGGSDGRRQSQSDDLRRTGSTVTGAGAPARKVPANAADATQADGSAAKAAMGVKADERGAPPAADNA